MSMQDITTAEYWRLQAEEADNELRQLRQRCAAAHHQLRSVCEWIERNEMVPSDVRNDLRDIYSELAVIAAPDK